MKVVGIVLADPLGNNFIDLGKSPNIKEVNIFLKEQKGKIVELTMKTQEQALLEAAKPELELKREETWSDIGSVPLQLPGKKGGEKS
jgi:Uma2 family endonuclease